MDRRKFLKFVSLMSVVAAAPAAAAWFEPSGGGRFGQKTVGSGETALDAINARRLQLEIDRTLSEAYFAVLDATALDPNDAITRARFTSCLSEVMQYFHDKRLVKEFRVIADGSNNPPSVLDTGIVCIDVVWEDSLYGRQFKFSVGPDTAALAEATPLSFT